MTHRNYRIREKVTPNALGFITKYISYYLLLRLTVVDVLIVKNYTENGHDGDQQRE